MSFHAGMETVAAVYMFPVKTHIENIDVFQVGHRELWTVGIFIDHIAQNGIVFVTNARMKLLASLAIGSVPIVDRIRVFPGTYASAVVS